MTNNDEAFFNEERTWEEIEESCGIEDHNTIKTLAAKNFKFFYKHILGADTNSELIQELISLVQNPPEQPENKATKIVVEAARGHSKTFTGTVAQTLWVCYRGYIEVRDRIKNTGVEVLIVSGSNEQSKDIINQIKRIILRNEALQHLEPATDYMNKYGDTTEIDKSEGDWNKKSFTATTDVRVKSKPYTSNIRGKHTDVFLLDDVLSDDGSRSIEKEKNIFYNVVSPTVENKHGRLQIVGTPRAHNDLIQELINKDSYHDAVYPAENDDGEILWSSKWDKDSLEAKKKEIGPARFAREYMCKPISKGEQFFPYDEVIEPNFDPEEKHFKPDVSKEEYKNWSFYLGVDVAYRTGSGADYSVLTTIGEAPNGQYYLCDIIRRKGLSPDQVYKEIKRLDKKYSYDKGLVETNAIGTGLGKTIEKDTSLATRIKGVDTTRKTRPEMLSNLQATLYRGDLTLVNHSVLVEEMTAFKNRHGKIKGKDHDDTVMALAIAWYSIEETSKGTAHLGIIEKNTNEEVPDTSFNEEEELIGII